MTILCPNVTSTLPFCESSCSRWTQVNRGEPIRVYHDIDATVNFQSLPIHVPWDPTFYAVATDPNPQGYLDYAINTWNDAYTCGTLFEQVDDPIIADVIFLYRETGVGSPSPDEASIGTASCFCDVDDPNTGCSVNVDHSSIFIPGSGPAWASINFYTPPNSTAGWSTLSGFLHTMMHELGHILGMGHTYNSVDINGDPIYSVVGSWNNSLPLATIQQWDMIKLETRYPCGGVQGCTVTEGPLQQPFQAFTTKDCPGCQSFIL